MTQKHTKPSVHTHHQIRYSSKSDWRCRPIMSRTSCTRTYPRKGASIRSDGKQGARKSNSNVPRSHKDARDGYANKSWSRMLTRNSCSSSRHTAMALEMASRRLLSSFRLRTNVLSVGQTCSKNYSLRMLAQAQVARRMPNMPPAKRDLQLW